MQNKLSRFFKAKKKCHTARRENAPTMDTFVLMKATDKTTRRWVLNLFEHFMCQNLMFYRLQRKASDGSRMRQHFPRCRMRQSIQNRINALHLSDKKQQWFAANQASFRKHEALFATNWCGIGNASHKISAKAAWHKENPSQNFGIFFAGTFQTKSKNY